MENEKKKREFVNCRFKRKDKVRNFALDFSLNVI